MGWRVMFELTGYQIVWGALFLITEFVLVYGAVHHIITQEIRNSRDAKRFNASVNYGANAMNTLAVGMVAAAVIIPAINEQGLRFWSAYWALAGVCLHIGGHLVLSLLKKEDGYE